MAELAYARDSKSRPARVVGSSATTGIALKIASLKGSVIIADNASDFGHLMKDYIEYVSKNSKYYSFLLNIDHGLLISVKL